MSYKILVTGGNGYLGGRLSRFLSKVEGLELSIGEKNIIEHSSLGCDNIKLLPLDVLDNDAIDECTKDVDLVIHLAALNEIECASDPEQALIVNGLGTLKVLNSSIKNKVKRFIYFSTAHVYGSPLIGKITESTLPVPAHPYSITHKVAEDFVYSANRSRQIQTIVFRLSNSFGTPVNKNINRWTLLVNDLCRQTIEEKRIILKSDGTQQRDFVTISDVCRAVLFFIQKNEWNFDNCIFNLGSSKTMSIIEMAQLVAVRAKVLFNLELEITKKQSLNNAYNDPDLLYSVDKLLAAGFCLNNDFNKEIDDTIMFCKRNF